jgi:hypothetical protein
MGAGFGSDLEHRASRLSPLNTGVGLRGPGLI